MVTISYVLFETLWGLRDPNDNENLLRAEESLIPESTSTHPNTKTFRETDESEPANSGSTDEDAGNKAPSGPFDPVHRLARHRRVLFVVGADDGAVGVLGHVDHVDWLALG